jgi:esterase/lipase superfamily enzyme
VLYDERNGSFTQFGFEAEQTLAPSGLLTASVEFTALNTKLVDTSGAVPVPDFISVLDFNASDSWFNTPANVRATMNSIWNGAKVAQINEIFFAALEDILASNLELTDIFKTSRLSAYSIRTVTPTSSVPTYE